MFTDLSGFSRGTEQYGVCHFLQVIHQSLQLYIPIIEDSLGTLLKVEGDSMMVLFRKPANALHCAFEMQHASREYNRGRAEDEKILLSVGLGWGKLLKFGNEDVYGQEVNVAAKLGEDHGVEGQVNVSHEFHLAVADIPQVEFRKLEIRPFGTEAAWAADHVE
jgi:class 3 adenylate cyclase